MNVFTVKVIQIKIISSLTYSCHRFPYEAIIKILSNMKMASMASMYIFNNVQFNLLFWIIFYNSSINKFWNQYYSGSTGPEGPPVEIVEMSFPSFCFCFCFCLCFCFFVVSSFNDSLNQVVSTLPNKIQKPKTTQSSNYNFVFYLKRNQNGYWCMCKDWGLWLYIGRRQAQGLVGFIQVNPDKILCHI